MTQQHLSPDARYAYPGAVGIRVGDITYTTGREATYVWQWKDQFDDDIAGHYASYWELIGSRTLAEALEAELKSAPTLTNAQVALLAAGFAYQGTRAENVLLGAEMFLTWLNEQEEQS